MRQKAGVGVEQLGSSCRKADGIMRPFENIQVPTWKPDNE